LLAEILDFQGAKSIYGMESLSKELSHQEWCDIQLNTLLKKDYHLITWKKLPNKSHWLKTQ